MTQSQDPKVNSNLILSFGIGFLVVIAAIGILVWIQQSQNNKPEISSTLNTATAISSKSSVILTKASNVSTTSNPNSINSNSDALVYKDGQYTATGQFQSPGGRKDLEVSLSIKDDSIDSYNIDLSDNDQTSQLYTDFFKEGIAGKINGKKIDNLSSSNVNIVNGSSLTSKGFLEALTAIKNKARN